jgi:hypothetical protein
MADGIGVNEPGWNASVHPSVYCFDTIRLPDAVNVEIVLMSILRGLLRASRTDPKNLQKGFDAEGCPAGKRDQPVPESATIPIWLVEIRDAACRGGSPGHSSAGRNGFAA